MVDEFESNNEADNEFGDFEEIQEKSDNKSVKDITGKGFKNKNPIQNTGFPSRVRTPRQGEVLGKIDQRVGANRVVVVCFDGKTRNCRIPGGLKRKIWARPGNIVLVRPWEFQGDQKGDLIFTYKPGDVNWLQKRGFLKDTGSDF